MKFTRDSLLLWLLLFASVLAYIASTGVPPWQWTFQQWLQSLIALTTAAIAKLQNSPLPSTAEKNVQDFQASRKVGLLFLIMTIGLGSSGCNPPPPNLTPEATAAWHNLQVIKGLDVLRDTAIDANATTPPQLSTETTRKVVLFHQSSLRIIQVSPKGWKATVAKGLEEVLLNLPSNERSILEPYIHLLTGLLKGVQ